MSCWKYCNLEALNVIDVTRAWIGKYYVHLSWVLVMTRQLSKTRHCTDRQMLAAVIQKWKWKLHQLVYRVVPEATKCNCNWAVVADCCHHFVHNMCRSRGGVMLLQTFLMHLFLLTALIAEKGLSSLIVVVYGCLRLVLAFHSWVPILGDFFLRFFDTVWFLVPKYTIRKT